MTKFLTKIIDVPIDGVDKWIWPNDDKGLWLGPSQEWPKHKQKILELCVDRNTVVQAGGACGMYPKLLSKIFKKVLTFEPDHYNFHCLSQNCVEENIYKFNCALSDRHGNVSFNPPVETNRGTGSIGPYDGIVPVLKIDDFVFDKLDLIYLDIEGAETSVLYGGMNSIRKHKPIVVCENAHSGPINVLLQEDYIITDRIGADTFFRHKSL